MSNSLKCPECGDNQAVFRDSRGFIACWKCDYREQEELMKKHDNTNDNLNNNKVDSSRQLDKDEYCPHGHGKMQLWEGELRCWKCGYPDKKRSTNSKRSKNKSNNQKTVATTTQNKQHNDIGFLDRLTGKGIEKIVNEYSETYGEILLGMHRELTLQKKKLEDYEDDLKELGTFDLSQQDGKHFTATNTIRRLARKLANNIADINNKNQNTLKEIDKLVGEKFDILESSVFASQNEIIDELHKSISDSNTKLNAVKLEIKNDLKTNIEKTRSNSWSLSEIRFQLPKLEARFSRLLSFANFFIIINLITSIIIIWKLS